MSEWPFIEAAPRRRQVQREGSLTTTSNISCCFWRVWASDEDIASNFLQKVHLNKEAESSSKDQKRRRAIFPDQ